MTSSQKPQTSSVSPEGLSLGFCAPGDATGGRRYRDGACRQFGVGREVNPTFKTVGSAARFFLARYRRCTQIGPYAVITVETRPSAFETRVFWGEEGGQVESFGVLFSPAKGAETAHARMCAQVRDAFAVKSNSLPRGLPPAA